MSQVTLLGLPDDLAQQLAQVLRAEAHQVNRRMYLQDLQRGPRAAVVFISGDTPDFRNRIALLRETEPALPVVVVTRLPGARQWLDALDSGAADYCGAPFERVQVRWIMQSVAPAARRAVA
jgi:DNA-binding NtrC family response regulator